MSTGYNMENKVNKLCTVFAFAPAPKTDFECAYTAISLELVKIIPAPG